MRHILLVLLIGLALSACTRREPEKKNPTHTAAKRVVEAAVGAGKVKHYKDTQDVLQGVNDKQKERQNKIP